MSFPAPYDNVTMLKIPVREVYLMTMYKYHAVIERENPEENTGAFIVSFPDLDNVFTDGETMLEAVENANEVLELMLETMLEEGDTFNPPSHVKDILPQLSDNASLLLVDVDVNIPEGAL